MYLQWCVIVCWAVRWWHHRHLWYSLTFIMPTEHKTEFAHRIQLSIRLRLWNEYSVHFSRCQLAIWLSDIEACGECSMNFIRNVHSGCFLIEIQAPRWSIHSLLIELIKMNSIIQCQCTFSDFAVKEFKLTRISSKLPIIAL